MSKRLVLFLFPFLLPLVLTAQSNYKGGYVVTLPGDTLKGFINYREWVNNPKEIEFKSSLVDSNIHSYTPENAKSFGIIGFEMYEVFKVSISMDEINPNGLRAENDTLKLTDTVFLKTILRGNQVNVFRYKDKLKERFYLQDRGDVYPVELRNQLNLKEGNIVSSVFKQQLTALAIKHKIFTLSQQIHGISYSKNDILKIIKQINKNNVTNFENALKTKPKARFFAGPGVSYGTMTYRGDNLITVDGMNANGIDKFKDKVVTQSYLPKFAVGADIYLNPEIRRLILRGEISATPMKSEVVSYFKYNSISDREQRNTYNLSLVIISAIPQVLYNLYNKESLKFYIGTGAAYSYYLKNQNVLTRTPADQPDGNPDEIINDYVGIKEMGLNLIVRSGVVIRGKFDLSVMYFNPTEITNYVSGNGGSVKVNNLQLSLNYIFGK